ncbi:hypothetical protein [Actinokineospora spheciospongiae]|uniref:hypothetical protein n=1 Tax=Actinokineospora spheciospongiae TaxID=909613 RepID=UPI000D90A0B5|nr:hypothetical protein DFQ13_12024 [Actinokineospora spheciospongiae]
MSDPRPDAHPAPEPGARSDAHPAPEPGARSDAHPAPEPGARPDAHPASESAPRLDAHPGSESGLRPEAHPAPESSSRPDEHPSAESDPEPGARLALEPDPHTPSHPTPEPAPSAEPHGQARPGLRAATRSGPGRLLIAVYALFALAACARSAVQLGTHFDRAPLAYLLSALAAVVYVVATVGLVRGSAASRRVAVVSCTVELVGVVAVGAFSLLDPAAFPDATVWSLFGRGYGFVPLVLPVLGLLWIRRSAAIAGAH